MRLRNWSIIKVFRQRLHPENLEIVSPGIDAIVRSQQMKKRYGFLSNDALTLQIMEDLRIDNLASNGSDFERVDFIKLYKPSVHVSSK